MICENCARAGRCKRAVAGGTCRNYKPAEEQKISCTVQEYAAEMGGHIVTEVVDIHSGGPWDEYTETRTYSVPVVIVTVAGSRKEKYGCLPGSWLVRPFPLDVVLHPSWEPTLIGTLTRKTGMC